MDRERFITKDDCFIKNNQSMFCVTETDSVQSIIRRALLPFVDKNVAHTILDSTDKVFYKDNRYTTVFMFTDETFQFFEVIASKENLGKYTWLLSNILYSNDTSLTSDTDIPDVNNQSKYNRDNVYCIRQLHLYDGDMIEDVVIYIPKVYFNE